MFNLQPRDYASHRPFPERSDVKESWYDRFARYLVDGLINFLPWFLNLSILKVKRAPISVQAKKQAISQLTDSELVSRLVCLKRRFRKGRFQYPDVVEGFALINEAAKRTIGFEYYPHQIMAGWCLLQGKLAEMATGEGKTFAATLPASLVAVSGYPVHVVTVNDYLAQRDAEKMKPLYAFLGLSTGVVLEGMSLEDRQSAYASDIVYCTNKELAFDYLKDSVELSGTGYLHQALERVVLGGRRNSSTMMRGLCFAIVDEADSVFVDEARTPLILSASTEGGHDEALYREILNLAEGLRKDRDFSVLKGYSQILLTQAGKQLLHEHLAHSVMPDSQKEFLLIQALSAIWIYQKGIHYVVHEGEVVIVDESTGRRMPDRSWEQGLHQMIELLEACSLTLPRSTLARITSQRFFSRYLLLSGMTGTAQEIKKELKSVYRLPVCTIPLGEPCLRKNNGARLWSSEKLKWQDVVTSIKALHKQKRPVLVGTRSVQASEMLSSILDAEGIEHRLLNALQDASEAAIVSRAGEAGAVTVATNMAGRGTDIILDDHVKQLGGLHVILTEYHESKRIDRQLLGRCARQGDPGSFECIVSLEDDIFRSMAPLFTWFLSRIWVFGKALPNALRIGLRFRAQSVAESRNRRLRHQTVKSDRKMMDVLAFSGQGE